MVWYEGPAQVMRCDSVRRNCCSLDSRDIRRSLTRVSSEHGVELKFIWTVCSEPVVFPLRLRFMALTLCRFGVGEESDLFAGSPMCH